MQDKAEQDLITKVFQWFIYLVTKLQEYIKQKFSMHRNRIFLLHKLWDTCLDELKTEY